jgi:hypothetical protein
VAPRYCAPLRAIEREHIERRAQLSVEISRSISVTMVRMAFGETAEKTSADGVSALAATKRAPQRANASDGRWQALGVGVDVLEGHRAALFLAHGASVAGRVSRAVLFAALLCAAWAMLRTGTTW